MAKQKFEISIFDGIDLGVSSEDSNQQSAVKTRNLNNLRSMGNLHPVAADKYFTRDGLSVTDTENIGISKDNWILNITAVKDGNKTNLVMISRGEGFFEDEPDTGGSIDMFTDIYSDNIDDSNLAGTDEALPNDLVIEGEAISANNSIDNVNHLKSDFNSSSDTVAVQKWNESLHIGLGNTSEEASKWVGKVKGGFTHLNKEDEDSVYGSFVCRNSYVKAPEGGVFSNIITDCYTDPGYLSSTPTEDELALRVGKYAYCHQNGGQYVYKYDCDSDDDGQIGSFEYKAKSPRLGNVQAICYDPNGTHANASFSEYIDDTDAVILVVDTGNSNIANFGGEIVLLKASDLEILAKYPIQYSGSGRDWDDVMTTRELGLDSYTGDAAGVGWVYEGARGKGIGSVLVTSPMDNSAGKKTIWIGIWGPHKIDGYGDDYFDPANDNFFSIAGGNGMHMASYRVLWSYTFDTNANWPANNTSLEFKNSSPPCHGSGNSGVYNLGIDNSDLGFYNVENGNGSNRCGTFRGDGYYFITLKVI